MVMALRCFCCARGSKVKRPETSGLSAISGFGPRRRRRGIRSTGAAWESQGTTATCQSNRLANSRFSSSFSVFVFKRRLVNVECPFVNEDLQHTNTSLLCLAERCCVG